MKFLIEFLQSLGFLMFSKGKLFCGEKISKSKKIEKKFQHFMNNNIKFMLRRRAEPL